MRAFSVTGFVVAFAGAMMIAERLRPGRLWPKVAGWWPRALLLNGVQVLSVYVAGLTTDRWLGAHRPWSADALGLWGGAAVGYVVHTFVYYWWHRARHAVPLLWRWVHQVHHSPSRIEVVTSFYKHPVEIVANALVSALIVYVLLGLSPESAALVLMVSGLAELFYHWNVRTPYWLGFLVQRPESHCVHHQRGRHTGNFADLPLWDLLFGTFHNPRRAPRQCGFGAEIEQRLPDLLMGRMK
jgi:sterol desaturase/sphingolipid hydroxylase (fatty acid hydroxylase superfamily)